MEEKFELTLHSAIYYWVENITRGLSNLQRIENILERIPDRINAIQLEIQNIANQVTTAKEEVAKTLSKRKL